MAKARPQAWMTWSIAQHCILPFQPDASSPSPGIWNRKDEQGIELSPLYVKPPTGWCKGYSEPFQLARWATSLHLSSDAVMPSRRPIQLDLIPATAFVSHARISWSCSRRVQGQAHPQMFDIRCEHSAHLICRCKHVTKEPRLQTVLMLFLEATATVL
jgi:hypothetical protein